MDKVKNLLEITFFARGGQGAKTAAEILAQGAVSEGKFVQAFPSFGPERSGAPIQTFLRVSNREVRTHEPVLNPDVVVVLDDTLLKTENITRNLKKDAILIVNSVKTAEELSRQLKFFGKIHAVDADGISLKIIGQLRPNTVILGKIIRIARVAKLESIQKEFRKIFAKKLGKEICARNMEAIKKAYDNP
ncbi:MAG: pyruvate synthase [Candidatus Moranbacteria bacterium CG06_land_8_20_14_3_00_40_12]|nr:MAG: pyruvate synthase [Candidatus Moranbacteria bacterium CG23_combo_of_CG06-09_8_20_14_all_40_16]PIU81075.1 MAG: pyruvate synthase [Candidatus Moranbacteria bacterium CG06_land_8_20_14_3_00_40_12]